jgi:dolichol-phosphate mannosyltransferase
MTSMSKNDRSIRSAIRYIVYSEESIFKEWRRLIKFCFVGLSGVAVGIGSLTLFIEVAGLSKVVAAVPATVLSISNNFTWNQIWTFRDRSQGSDISTMLRQWFKFLFSSAGTLGVNLGVYALLTEVFDIQYILSALCAIAVATPLNFLISTLWVWRLSPSRSSESALQRSPELKLP